jgi:hypothetical protein
MNETMLDVFLGSGNNGVAEAPAQLHSDQSTMARVLPEPVGCSTKTSPQCRHTSVTTLAW